jgi:hypothetical protein
MSKLISDRAQVEISKKVTDILPRALFISSWHSEPHQQHQNYAENRYQTVKTMGNTILDCMGAPSYTWLLCITYNCFILNFTVVNPSESPHMKDLLPKRTRAGRDPHTPS